MTYAFYQGQRVGIENHARWVAGTFWALLGDDKAEVRFRSARQPMKCAACGSTTISENICTGEVVCMRSGCGHNHGFDTHVEELPLSMIKTLEERSARA